MLDLTPTKIPPMEKPKTYTLAGGDGGCYGPNFGPVLAQELGELKADGTTYLMLKLVTPIHLEKDQIDYIVVSPRYVGDTLRKLRKKGCRVGIGRVLPEQHQAVQLHGISDKTVEYWAIGTCKPA